MESGILMLECLLVVREQCPDMRSVFDIIFEVEGIALHLRHYNDI